MRLSSRLEAIASFVPACRCVADVGTDHGYIPIRLVEAGVAGSAIAMDVREGPLGRAREHVRERGFEGRIGLRLGNGLERLEAGEADVVVIAGMGGELMRRILEEGERLWGEVGRWVLSPQSEWGMFRRFLVESGFFIGREEMVEEDGKFYLVLDAFHGKDCADGTGARHGSRPESREGWSDAEYLYGKRLMEARHPVLRTYLERERRQKASIARRLAGQGGEGAVGRLSQVRGELHMIEEVLYGMQEGH